jgi:hypothetical protein
VHAATPYGRDDNSVLWYQRYVTECYRIGEKVKKAISVIILEPVLNDSRSRALAPLSNTGLTIRNRTLKKEKKPWARFRKSGRVYMRPIPSAICPLQHPPV